MMRSRCCFVGLQSQVLVCSRTLKDRSTDATKGSRVIKYCSVFVISGKRKLFAVKELMTATISIGVVISYN